MEQVRAQRHSKAFFSGRFFPGGFFSGGFYPDTLLEQCHLHSVIFLSIANVLKLRNKITFAIFIKFHKLIEEFILFTSEMICKILNTIMNTL